MQHVFFQQLCLYQKFNCQFFISSVCLNCIFWEGNFSYLQFKVFILPLLGLNFPSVSCIIFDVGACLFARSAYCLFLDCKFGFTGHKILRGLISSGRKFKCDHCGLLYSTVGNLRIHIKDKHDLDASSEQTCSLCGQNFMNRSSLRSHTWKYHQQRLSLLTASSVPTVSHDETHVPSTT